MNNSLRIAKVFVSSQLAGILAETDEGYSFVYEKKYLLSNFPSISLTLPKREEAYVSPTLFSFFDGLIPEGWLLSVVSRNWKISSNDRFGLLLVSCKDCIGNVTIEEVSQ